MKTCRVARSPVQMASRTERRKRFSSRDSGSNWVFGRKSGGEAPSATAPAPSDGSQHCSRRQASLGPQPHSLSRRRAAQGS